MIKYYLLLSLLCLPLSARQWACEGEGHRLKLDENSKTAILFGKTTGYRNFDLKAVRFRSQITLAGKINIGFAITGPQTWKQDTRVPEGWAEIRYNRVRETYEANLRRLDTYVGSIETLPYLLLDCEARND